MIMMSKTLLKKKEKKFRFKMFDKLKKKYFDWKVSLAMDLGKRTKKLEKDKTRLSEAKALIREGLGLKPKN